MGKRINRQHDHPGPDHAGRGVPTARVFTRSDAAQLGELVARVDAGDLS